MVRYEIVFKGRVQGVGFRYLTQQYAGELGLAGWVRNLPNGDVQAVVEGEEKAILDLIARLQKAFVVREKIIDKTAARGEFFEFEISY